MRIQKYIAETGLCSRRKAEEYIREGKITVNGKKAVIGQNIEENDIKEDTSNVEEVYNIENIIEEKTSGLSQNTDVIDTAEINKKLEEENELKFDEMYQKAFGAEVSEKRKERLKNEEKIDRNINSKNSKK